MSNQQNPDDNIDLHRRRFLTTAATVVGGMGVAATSIPFISTMTPSAKTRAIGGPVEVDLGDMKPGERKIIKWQGKPIWILKRSDKTLSTLGTLNDELRDPNSGVEQQPGYAKNEYRSIKPEYLVVIGLCTHLGCSPNYFPAGVETDFGPEWKGGFFCPCHGSLFDLAGRVYKGVPAPANLVVPPYRFLTESRIIVGQEEVS